jgi:hypothetical protein
MATLHHILFYIHVFCGAIGLIVFWLPMLVKKGGHWHVLSGKIFSNGMLIVSVSGLFMSAILLIDPVAVRYPQGGLSAEQAEKVILQNRNVGIFLLMLSLLVFVNVRHSILVLKAKSNRGLLKDFNHIGSISALFLAGVAVGLLAWNQSNTLFAIFSVLSIVSAIGLARYIFKAELKPREWIIEHLTNIIGSGIGAYTAFFAFGGRRFFNEILVGQLQLLPWILPSVIGITGSIYLAKKYRKQYRVS